MLTTTAICNLYAWIYTHLPVPAGTWDHLLPVAGAYGAIKRVDGVSYVAMRGSFDGIDWVEDFFQLSIPINDPILGPVHPGARFGVLEIKPIIDDLVGDDPVVFVGHSLGAMHAALLAGYRAAAGKRVDGLVMFGEPKTGGPQLSSILAKTPVQSFRNADKDGHDRVTDYSILSPYQHVRSPLTDCWHSPRANDLWLIFRYHHFGHYCRAFGCGSPQALSLPI